MPDGTTDDDIDMIFQYYDKSQQGRIDYKELSKMLYVR